MLIADDFHIFLAASLAVNLTPGPDMLYVATRSATQGRAAGLVSALAIGTGCLAHIAAAALGLSAALMYSPEAFRLLKWGGAAYLVYMGLRTALEAWRPLPEARLQPAPLSAIFRQGVVVNVLNPKVALFFLSFLPQFVDTAAGNVPARFVFLGMVFNIGGTAVNSLVALGCGLAGQRLLRGRARTIQGVVSGSIFISLGLALGLS